MDYSSLISRHSPNSVKQEQVIRISLEFVCIERPGPIQVFLQF